MNIQIYQRPDGWYQCTDEDTFDGTADSPDYQRVVGFGKTKRSAVEDWAAHWANVMDLVEADYVAIELDALKQAGVI